MNFIIHRGKKIYTWWGDYGNTIKVTTEKPSEDVETLKVPNPDTNRIVDKDGHKSFFLQCPWLDTAEGYRRYYALIVDLEGGGTWRPVAFNSVKERDAAMYGSSFFDHDTSKRLCEVIVDLSEEE